MIIYKLQLDLSINRLPVPLIAIPFKFGQVVQARLNKLLGLANFAGGFAFGVFEKLHLHPFRCRTTGVQGCETILDIIA